MKRFVITFTIICFSVLTFGQSFLGVKYGTSFKDAFSIYNEKYHNSCQEAGQNILIVSPTVGGCVFDCAIANFSVKNGKSVLDGGVMFREKNMSELDEQLELEKRLIEKMKIKYGSDILESTDKDGFPMLSFGKKIRDDGKWLGSVSIVLRNDDTCALVLNYLKIGNTEYNDL